MNGSKRSSSMLRSSATGEPSPPSEQMEGQLCADKAWRRLFRNTGATGAPPSPRSFPGPQVTAIVQTLLGLDGKHALAWCIHAYLTRTGKTAEGIAQAIIAGAFGEKVFIEAIGAALKKLEAEPKLYPRGITGKIASLLSRSFSTRSTPGRGTSVAALVTARPPPALGAKAVFLAADRRLVRCRHRLLPYCYHRRCYGNWPSE
jgi:hypothetical protein